MLVHTLPLTSSAALAADPLTRAAFAPFGEVLSNPAPDVRPSNTEPYTATATLPFAAELANQGTAIKYATIASLRNLYAKGQAPSGRPAEARMTMFVCGARMPLPPPPPPSSSSTATSQQQQQDDGGVGVKVLERHPFTTQTFIPLTADASKRYLVIVAPSLPPSALDEGLPVPDPSKSYSSSSSSSLPSPSPLPGRGMPDLTRLRAFIATGEQAVTYGVGTWHAPMVALGPPNTTVDFLVFQFANDTALEDCQEVALESNSSGDGPKPQIVVRLDAATTVDSRTSKL